MHVWNIVSARNLKRHCLDLRVMKGVWINLLWSRINFCLCCQPSFTPSPPSAFTPSGIQDGGYSHKSVGDTWCKHPPLLCAVFTTTLTHIIINYYFIWSYVLVHTPLPRSPPASHLVTAPPSANKSKKSAMTDMCECLSGNTKLSQLPLFTSQTNSVK